LIVSGSCPAAVSFPYSSNGNKCLSRRVQQKALALQAESEGFECFT
jgi:hypothetical protein